MPTISMFFGIIIRMYFAPGEHPPPHFHAYYNEYKATVDIRTCEIIEGDLPGRQTKLVLAWAELHKEERRVAMYPSVKEVSPRDDYTLSLVFENGEKGVLDMKPILEFGVFQRLKDLGTFKRVCVAFDTIEWACGVDLDPEYIYAKCRERIMV